MKSKAESINSSYVVDPPSCPIFKIIGNGVEIMELEAIHISPYIEAGNMISPEMAVPLSKNKLSNLKELIGI